MACHVNYFVNLACLGYKLSMEITLNEDLRNHCTMQVGGKADYFYVLKNSKELPILIKFARENKIPYLLIGKGSNILFSDKGFRGLVIKNEIAEIKFTKNKVTADSGVVMSTLVQETVKNGFSPLEKWAGLPGTVGAAVYGNAGCNGLEAKDILFSAKIFNPKTGKTKVVTNKYFQFKYRHSILKKTGEVVLQATFSLQKSKLSPQEQKSIIAEVHQNRIKKQPFGLSSGSFFKNPSPEKPAGMLIDQVGLKGKTIGLAQISPKHANFLLNLGGAKSADILKLAKLAQGLVKAKFGITLSPEVQLLSEIGKTVKL